MFTYILKDIHRGMCGVWVVIIYMLGAHWVQKVQKFRAPETGVMGKYEPQCRYWELIDPGSPAETSSALNYWAGVFFPAFFSTSEILKLHCIHLIAWGGGRSRRRTQLSQKICGSQKTTWRNWFSPSAMWARKSSGSGLVTITLLTLSQLSNPHSGMVYLRRFAG